MLFSGSACLSGDDLAEGQQLIYFIYFYLLRGGLQEPLWPTNARISTSSSANLLASNPEWSGAKRGATPSSRNEAVAPVTVAVWLFGSPQRKRSEEAGYRSR